MNDKKPEKITEDQHYVPQFYLKQWLDEAGGFYPVKVEEKLPPKLKIFDKKSDQSRFCYENFFYAQHTGIEDEVSQIIEKQFAEIEAIFSNELPILEKKILNYEQITETEKYHLAECMIFLHFRGKKYLDQSKKMTDEVTKEMMKHWVHLIDKDPKSKAHMEELGLTKEQMVEFVHRGEFTVDYGNIHHLQILKDMHGFSNILSAKFWRVFISRKGDFITTDAPYLDMAVNKTFWGNDFLSREQSFILSPRVMILAIYPKNENGKKFVRKDITDDRGYIQQLNLHNLMNAIRFGFHKDRELLVELERLIHLVYQMKEREKASKI
ncbi:MAG: hypothetical protein QG665_439 [Patescibacteria group bacterium]|nr:hypothetical protein [Patescibacteria group bacterium]